MSRTSEQSLRDAIAEVLGESTEGLTARTLVYRLRARGWKPLDKSTVNSVLYRDSNYFQKDLATPPRWFMGDDDVPDDDLDDRSPPLAGMTANNWKSLRDANGVALANISLFFGANSSGKTSLLQSLLVLQQSWGSDRLVYEGPSASCESFKNVAHNHELNRHVALGIAILTDDEHLIQHYVRTAVWDDDADTERASTVTFTIDGNSLVFLHVPAEEPYWLSGAAGLFDFAAALGLPWADPESNYVYFFDDAEDGWPGDIIGINRNDEYHEVPFRLRRRWQEQSRQWRRDFGSVLSRIEHLGPMRSVPSRWVSGALSDQPDGGDVVRRLQDADLREDVNEWLQRLEIPYVVDVEATHVDGETRLALVLARRGASHEKVKLQDVGYGISQVLPLVVMALAGRDRIIVVEQPEVHLHPRLQSRLADLLVTSAQDYGNRLLVETHSEHLLLRLQRRIAEERFDPDELAVYHVTRPSGAAEIERIEIDATGEMIGGWPTGFFDDRLEDMVAIASPRMVP